MTSSTLKMLFTVSKPCAILSALAFSGVSGFSCVDAPVYSLNARAAPGLSFSHSPATTRGIKTRASARASPTSTALSVWWFGGTPSSEPTSESDDSCELVAVRIERTSPNSRRIGGEITVDCPIDDVWAILTDYDNLSTHVPNLVESRRVDGYSSSSGGEQGDGSYTCRLFQKGSQKIIGFNFAASVTMDMVEAITSGDRMMGEPLIDNEMVLEERRIGFKCVESQFFTEFDGEWRVSQSLLPDPLTGQVSTTVSYVVDVRPKGPVPVAALEWRIREDVPTNLRAVKKAAIQVGYCGVMDTRNKSGLRSLPETTVPEAVMDSTYESAPLTVKSRITRRGAAAVRTGRKLVGKATDVVTAAAVTASAAATQKGQVKLAPVRVTWLEDETMATYLNE